MALINLRNALMAGKRLPYDAEVEYLESTGTQYVNTGLNYFADFEIGIKLRTSIPNKALGTSSAMCMERRSASDPTWRLSVNGYPYYSGASIVDYHVMSWKGGVFAADGVTAYTVSNPFTSGTMTLFGAGRQYFPNMIYACKLWDANGVLVRDYIPVRVGTVGYLYDRVSGKLFGNAGTGDFVLGQDVVPVEYIESHGTEYLNLDFGFDRTDTIDTKFSLPTTTASDKYLNSPSSWNTDNNRFGFGLYLTYFACAFGAQSTVNAPFGPYTTNDVLQHVWTYSDDKCHITDLNLTRNVSQVNFGSTTSNLRLFYGYNAPTAATLIYYKHSKNGTPKINAIPIRVGTEGAMMDVLTRRIYRNAGTGAFAYGNDLKYPIPAE